MNVVWHVNETVAYGGRFCVPVKGVIARALVARSNLPFQYLFNRIARFTVQAGIVPPRRHATLRQDFDAVASQSSIE